jgi:hypothetical protein
VLGVTVGVGPRYEALARVAAACLHAQTGIRSVVLSRDELCRSGLRHPAALKLAIFDFVNTESVLYFDADWLCVNPWFPSQFTSRSRIVACSDFVLETDWPAETFDFEGERLQLERSPRQFVGVPRGPLRSRYVSEVNEVFPTCLPPRHWINTGMFIVNRRHHGRWLEHARDVYEREGGHHEKYYEQPALMRALADLQIGVDRLPRVHNVLVTVEKRLPSCVVGAHLKFSKTNRFPTVSARLTQNALTPDAVREILLAE